MMPSVKRMLLVALLCEPSQPAHCMVLEAWHKLSFFFFIANCGIVVVPPEVSMSRACLNSPQ